MLAPALGPAIAGLGAEREPSRCSDLLLLYHAIELYLKALLRSDGRDLKSIKDLSLRITKPVRGLRMRGSA